MLPDRGPLAGFAFGEASDKSKPAMRLARVQPAAGRQAPEQGEDGGTDGDAVDDDHVGSLSSELDGDDLANPEPADGDQPGAAGQHQETQPTPEGTVRVYTPLPDAQEDGRSSQSAGR